MISIIITAYNVANTIEKAIMSCINQTYKDLEIIVVEDCSTDNTLEIIESLQSNYRQIRLLKNKTNKGAGISRRIGTQAAKGTHTIFLDGDDYYKEDCIETLYNAYLKSKADIIHPGYIAIFNDIQDIRTPPTELLTGNDKYKPDKADTKRFLNTMLVNAKLWQKVTYSDRRFIEDTPTLFKLIYYANAVYSIDYAGYYYVQNNASLCHTANEFKKKLFLCLCAKSNIEFIKDKIPNSLDENHYIKIFEELQELNADLNEYLKYPNECAEVLYYLIKCLNIL